MIELLRFRLSNNLVRNNPSKFTRLRKAAFSRIARSAEINPKPNLSSKKNIKFIFFDNIDILKEY